jgi:hypothetical protein
MQNDSEPELTPSSKKYNTPEEFWEDTRQMFASYGIPEMPSTVGPEHANRLEVKMIPPKRNPPKQE